MTIPKIKCRTCLGTGKVDDWTNIGPILRAERKSKRVHGTKVARLIGIDKSTLHDMEKGIRPHLWTAAKVSAYRKAIGALAKAKKANRK